MKHATINIALLLLTSLATADIPTDFQLTHDGNISFLLDATDTPDQYTLLYRPQSIDTFVALDTSITEPVTLTYHRGRLHLFMRNGRSVIITDQLNSRAGRRLPTGLVPLDCTVHQERLCLLTLADDPVRLPTPDNNDPCATVQFVSLEAGDVIAVMLSGRHQWISLTTSTLPCAAWRDLTLVGDNAQLYVFGRDDNEQLALLTISSDEASTASIDTVTGPFTALGLPDGPVVILAQGAGDNSQYVIGRLHDTEWRWSPPLSAQPDELLQAPPGQVRFTSTDDSIFGFVRTAASEFHAGSWTAGGELITPLQQTIRVGEGGPIELPWVYADWFRMALALGFVAILFWKRQEAFGLAALAPPILPTAPLWRRLLAFICDLIPAAIVMEVLAHLLIDTTQINQDFAAMLAELRDSQELTAWLMAQGPDFWRAILLLMGLFLATLTAYMGIFEYVMQASPGKRLLGLRVVGQDGKPARPGQIAARNLIRILELYSDSLWLITLFVVAFSRRRQRIGDLASGTVVIYQGAVKPLPSVPQEGPSGDE